MWVTVHCAISFGKVLLKSLVNFENKIIFCVFPEFAFYSVLFAALKLFFIGLLSSKHYAKIFIETELNL